MLQRSVSTFSRMFCSHVGVSDHSATLSVPRCQAIDLYTGALTDLRCITTKCKCKSSLFPTLSTSSLFLAARVTSESAREIKTTGEESKSISRESSSSYLRIVKHASFMRDSSEFHISSTDKNDYSSLE